MNRREAIRGIVASSAFGAGPFEVLLEAGRHVRATGRPAQGFTTLDTLQATILSELTDIIVPRTDTPGAVDAGVAEFIDLLLGEWMDPADRDAFISGIDRVDARSRREHDAGFMDVSDEARLAIVAALDEEVTALRAPADEAEVGAQMRPSEHFFFQLKRLTLLGYFTSAPGMNEALRHNPYPGRWDPCVTMESS